MNESDLLEALVRIPSPTGHEADAVRYLQEQARRDGFRVLEDSVGNFVAEAGAGDRLLFIVGHIDTVAGHIPVRREGSTLWGRGSVDAKGPLVAAYAAARRFVLDPRLRIRIVGAVDEEGNSRGAQAVPKDLRPEWIIVGEPSGVHGLTLGYKGIVRGALRAQRDRHHGAHREPSAVEAVLAFWNAVGAQWRFDDHFDSVQGRLDAMNTTTDGLVDRVEARFNVRLPPNLLPEQAERQLAEIASRHDVQVDVDERMPAAEAPRRGPLVAAFLSAIRGRGATPHVKRKTGTADFNLFAHRHPGVPIVAYGPGDAALDHTPHERLDIDEFSEAVAVLVDVIERFAQAPSAHTQLTTVSGAVVN